MTGRDTEAFRGTAAGLVLRCDHGSQYTSDHFQTELKHFGIRQTLADLRKALTDFVDLYNHRWRLEKLDGRSPEEARQAWLKRQAA